MLHFRHKCLVFLTLLSDLVRIGAENNHDKENVELECLQYEENIKTMYFILIALSNMMQVNLTEAITSKMTLNDRKYPFELVMEGCEDKYTRYTQHTGIDLETNQNEYFEISRGTSTSLDQFCSDLPGIITSIQDFADKRGWLGDYTKKNLIFCLASEFGETADIIRFCDEETVMEQLDGPTHKKLCQEIADITIFLTRLTLTLGVDAVSLLRRHSANEDVSETLAIW